MLLAVSDVVWQAIIGGVVAVILGYMQHRTRRLVEVTANKASKERSQATEEIKDGQASVYSKLDEVADVGNKVEQVENKVDLANKQIGVVKSEVGQTHGIVNSQREAMLARIDALEKALAKAVEALAADRVANKGQPP